MHKYKGYQGGKLASLVYDSFHQDHLTKSTSVSTENRLDLFTSSGFDDECLPI